MVRKYEARGAELGGDAFYEDWVEVVRYEDYAKLEALYAAAIELMVSAHRRYNTDASPALQELYEKASGANEPGN